MHDDYAAARERIARQKGRLTGWRPLHITNDVAVTALEVLGDVRGEPAIGLRVVVAGRSGEALDRDGERAADAALRRRAVLGPTDSFVVERRGPLHEGDGGSGDDPLRWSWRALTFHAPADHLPAIAGLATDAVRGG
jgi:hypothetical protein